MAIRTSLERYCYADPIRVQYVAVLVLKVFPEDLLFEPDGTVSIKPDTLNPNFKEDEVYLTWKGNISDRYRALQDAIKGCALPVANNPAPKDPATGDFRWDVVVVRVADLQKWLKERN